MPPLFGDDGDEETTWIKPVEEFSAPGVVRLVNNRRNFAEDALDFPLHFATAVSVIPSLGILVSQKNMIILLSATQQDRYRASIYAGGPNEGFSNGFRTKATFHGVHGICSDSQGDLLVCDTQNGAIRRIDTQGDVSTFVGYMCSPSVDGPKNKARFQYPTSIVALPNGNFLVAEGHKSCTIRKITPKGHVSTLELPTDLGIINSLSLGVIDPQEVFVSIGSGLFKLGSSFKTLDRVVPQEALSSSKECHQLSDGRLLVLRPFGPPVIVSQDGKAHDLLESLGLHAHECPDPDAVAFPDFPESCASARSNGCIFALGHANSCEVLRRPGSPDAIIISDSDSARQAIFEFSPSKPPHRIAGRPPSHIVSGLTVSPTGHVIEYGGSCIRWMDENGEFHVLAGSQEEYGFLDSTLSKARFLNTSSVCFIPINPTDDMGHMSTPVMTRPSMESPGTLWSRLFGNHTLLVADMANHRIRAIVPAMDTSSHASTLDGIGEVVTFSGTGKRLSVDGSLATASFKQPGIIRRHPITSDLWISEQHSFTLRLIRNGFVTTLKHNIQSLLHGINAQYQGAPNLQPSCIKSMVFGPDSKLHITAAHAILRIDNYHVDVAIYNPNGAPVASATVVHAYGGKMGFSDEVGVASQFSPALQLAYNPVEESLLVSDLTNHRVRRIHNNRVTTLASAPANSLLFGLPSKAAMMWPRAICCLPDGTALVSTDCLAHIDYQLVPATASTAAPSSPSSSSSSSSTSFGFSNLLPASCSPDTPASDAHSDHRLQIGDSVWHLHKVILKARCPGLLDDAVVQKIHKAMGGDSSTATSIEFFQALLRSAYTDFHWRPAVRPPAQASTHPGLTKTTPLVDLCKWYTAAQWARCSRLQRSAEMAITEFFHARVWDHSYVTSILSDIAALSEHAEAILRLYLPFAAYSFNMLFSNVTNTEAAAALAAKPELAIILRDYVVANTIELPSHSIYDYHEEWTAELRSLLCSSEAGQPIPASAIELASDIVIQGEKKQFHCHRVILESRCGFFKGLFGSKFRDATESTWSPTKDTSDSFYLNDDALAAMFDFIYTNSPTKMMAPEVAPLLVSALPFYFLEEYPRIQVMMGVCTEPALPVRMPIYSHREGEE